MQGWITLHRKVQDNNLWLAEPFTRGQAWVDLLLLANHSRQLLYKRNIPIIIERGQVGWSQERLSKRWKWGRKKIKTFLKTLEREQQIIIESNHTLSRIIIVNYDKYQYKEQQSHNSRTTKDTNNNNDNNDNNVSEQSSELKDNQKDMPWNKQPDDNEEVVIDDETGETREDNDENAVKELNEKIRYNLKLVESFRGLPFGKGKDLNFHVKIYRELLDKGWTHEKLIETIMDLIKSPYWIEKKKSGEFPGMNTVNSLLRNKQPS